MVVAKPLVRRKARGGSTLIEIQRSLVDPVLFSRSSMGDQDFPRQYRSSRGERNSIIPEDRISLGQKQIPRSLFPCTLSLSSFLPSFLLPVSLPHLRGQPARRTGYLISFIHQPFSRPRDLHPLPPHPRKGRKQSAGCCSANSANCATNFFIGERDRHRFPPLSGCWISRKLNYGDCSGLT